MGSLASLSQSSHKWWKESVIYQIYPASFQDSNGDGWGDIKGMIDRVEYLKQLGVDVMWTSPIYKSPQADMGYDISDYKSIDPKYGTLEDVDELISRLHKHDMKLMMDLVVNHTSDQHAWFLESARSKSSPKRDWYIWKPPKSVSEVGVPEPPNNWAQILGDANSAWTYDEGTGEYYLCLFTPEQPDLNWENPEVVEAVHDVMHFWLKRGVSGFRMDVINLISKDQRFPDAPEIWPGAKYHPGDKYYINGPRLHEFLHGLYVKVLSEYDTVTVGEMPGVNDINEIIRTVGSKSEELNMIFIFDIVDIDNAPGQSKFSLRDWKLGDMKKILSTWQRNMIEYDGWNSLFLENHDQPRSVTRYVDDSDEFRDRGAKLLALMQTTMGGSLFVYQGEEIGMRNFPLEWDPEIEYKDIESINFFRKMKKMYPAHSEKLKEARHILQMKARDHARTPVQWNSERNAGFCSPDITPWMRVNDDYKTINVKAQKDFTDSEQLSVWQFWQRGLQDRKEHKDAFVYGDYEEIDVANPDVFAYIRTGKKSGKWLVVLNWKGTSTDWTVPDGIEVSSWVASTCSNGKPEKMSASIKLETWEGLLGRCK